MARKKKKRRPVNAKVDPSAFSIRSTAMGVCTVFCDASALDKINSLGFDPIRVSRNQSPKNSLSKLKRLAGRGTWMAVESNPEIIDSDGCPALDVVFRRKSRSSNPPKVKPPKERYWYDPVTQYLDLPTGQLLVVFEYEFFNDGYDQVESRFEITSVDDEDLHNSGYADSDSYIIHCKPGFYHATVFSVFMDWDYPDEDNQPELAVYLTPVDKPKSFKMSEAILPVHPTDQDHETLRRSTLGLAPRKPQKPTWQKEAYLGDVRRSLVTDWMEVPVKFQKKLGVEPGLMLSLEVDGNQLDGVITNSSTPDPSVWDLIEKEKRKSKNFATFQFNNDKMIFEVLKQARKGGFDLPEGVGVTGRLKVLRDKSGNPKRIATKVSAQDHPDTIQIPKRLGKPGKHVANVIPEMERCFSWTQCCLIEIDGKTMMAAINVCPPISDKNIDGDPFTMDPVIEAIWSEFRDGEAVNQEIKTFRGWPEGVGRAFQAITKKCKGGILWTNRFEVDRNFWNRKPSGKAKDAEKAAIAAWKEVFGIEID